MKNKFTRRERILVCVGLLMVSCSSILTRVGLPDFFRGFMIGLGLAMELVGVVSIMRRKRCVSDTGSTEGSV